MPPEPMAILTSKTASVASHVIGVAPPYHSALMVIRGATNRIICLNKSTSAPFSSNSFGLVIVVLPVQVRLLQTQPWPRTTMANAFRRNAHPAGFSDTTF